jgi:phosphatidylethanolamine-binding protein (PEBP) family uncharacterized protein
VGTIGYSPRDDHHFYGYADQKPAGLDQSAHRYEFENYAMDITLDPAPKNRENLEKAMKAHIVAKGKYSGTFKP